MAQYIDKDALVEGITNLKVRYECGWNCAIDKVLKHIDDIEVKEEFKIGETEIYLDDDGGEPPYGGKQWLDLSCMEYEIPSDKFKDGDTVEIIIRKTRKGE